MRSKFGHHIPLSPEEQSKIWDSAIVTVDTNVLLDLYRYDEPARQSILSALEHFSGRLWLSHQVATEFFRNRKRVISDARHDFQKADDHLARAGTPHEETAKFLRSIRAVPGAVADGITNGVRALLDTARAQVTESAEAYPDYLNDDPILSRILDLFDQSVGDAPTPEQHATMCKEAERRARDKIPPGYLDAAKDGDRFAGDYILWWQVLEHARQKQSPIILVTSERKEDWWEKHHGKRVGPRFELMEEAEQVAGQRVILYERENFLSHVATRKGEHLARSVLQEIRSVTVHSQRGHVDTDVDDLVRNALDDFAVTLTDNDETITGLIAETNCTGFHLDDVDIISAGPIDLNDVTIPFTARLQFSGEQDTERMFFGDSISATLTGELRFDGTEWEVSDNYNISAEVDVPDEDDRYHDDE